MSYIPVLILLALGLVLGVVILVASQLLGARLPNRRKNMPFECGVPGEGSARRRFSVRFYLVALLFLLFDVEGIFFIPWAIAFKKYLGFGPVIIIEMAFFVGALLVAYFYVLKKGALEWE